MVITPGAYIIYAINTYLPVLLWYYKHSLINANNFVIRAFFTVLHKIYTLYLPLFEVDRVNHFPRFIH